MRINSVKIALVWEQEPKILSGTRSLAALKQRIVTDAKVVLDVDIHSSYGGVF